MMMLEGTVTRNHHNSDRWDVTTKDGVLAGAVFRVGRGWHCLAYVEGSPHQWSERHKSSAVANVLRKFKPWSVEGEEARLIEREAVLARVSQRLEAARREYDRANEEVHAALDEYKLAARLVRESSTDLLHHYQGGHNDA